MWPQRGQKLLEIPVLLLIRLLPLILIKGETAGYLLEVGHLAFGADIVVVRIRARFQIVCGENGIIVFDSLNMCVPGLLFNEVAILVSLIELFAVLFIPLH